MPQGSGLQLDATPLFGKSSFVRFQEAIPVAPVSCDRPFAKMFALHSIWEPQAREDQRPTCSEGEADCAVLSFVPTKLEGHHPHAIVLHPRLYRNKKLIDKKSRP